MRGRRSRIEDHLKFWAMAEYRVPSYEDVMRRGKQSKREIENLYQILSGYEKRMDDLAKRLDTAAKLLEETHPAEAQSINNMIENYE